MPQEIQNMEETTRVFVTDHAAKRIKERLGLSRKAVERQASKAMQYGIHPAEHQSAEVRKWFASMALTSTCHYRFYNGFLYVFRIDHNVLPALVTVYSPSQSDDKREKYYSKGQGHYKDATKRKFSKKYFQ